MEKRSAKDKNPGGRPRLAKHLSRTPFQVRLSSEEKAILDMAARHQGLELSTWIRTLCMETARKIVSKV